MSKQCDDAYEALGGVYKEGGGNGPSLEFVRWATCVLNSRCFELSGIDKEEPRKCLVPFADILNHSFSPTLSHEVDSDGNLIFKAARPIAEGDELTITYRSDKDACSFLLNYGFFPQDSDVSDGGGPQGTRPNEVRVYCRVAFDVDECVAGTPLYAAVQSLGIAPSADVALPASLEQPLPALWVWLLRLKGMDDSQRMGFIQGQVALSASVEEAAWDTIRSTLEAHRPWYENAKAIATGPSSGSASEDACGPMEKFIGQIRETAISVSSAALEALPPSP